MMKPYGLVLITNVMSEDSGEPTSLSGYQLNHLSLRSKS